MDNVKMIELSEQEVNDIVAETGRIGDALDLLLNQKEVIPTALALMAALSELHEQYPTQMVVAQLVAKFKSSTCDCENCVKNRELMGKSKVETKTVKTMKAKPVDGGLH